MTLADIARQINPLLRGWIEYYGRYVRVPVERDHRFR
jgi:RNA-directed DNA polymerase